MENIEEIVLMEVSDDGDLEEYDYSIVDDDFAECARCGKTETVQEDDEYGAQTGIYHCLKCREEIPIEDYFKNLKSKGLLKEYGNWIIRTYPQFKKYVLNS